MEFQLIWHLGASSHAHLASAGMVISVQKFSPANIQGLLVTCLCEAQTPIVI